MEGRPIRFNELSNGIEGISSRILSKQLKEMENDGLIKREVFAEVPARVEYSFTQKAESLMPILKSLAEWGRDNMFSQRVIFDESIDCDIDKSTFI